MREDEQEPTSTTKGTECLEGMRGLEALTEFQADARENRDMTNIYQAMNRGHVYPSSSYSLCVVCMFLIKENYPRNHRHDFPLTKHDTKRGMKWRLERENKCKTDTRSTSSWMSVNNFIPINIRIERHEGRRFWRQTRKDRGNLYRQRWWTMMLLLKTDTPFVGCKALSSFHSLSFSLTLYHSFRLLLTSIQLLMGLTIEGRERKRNAKSE